MADPSLYTIGGTVQAHEGGLYLSRPADGELLRHCREAAFAYVLTPRQLGKSSLMIRTAERLIEEGIRPVVIDLTQIGTQLEAEAWHGDFLDLVAGQLMLSTDARQWWKSHSDAGLTLRLTRFFEEVVLQEVAEPIVIFVDEIDTTLSLPFTDDFFAAIRYLYVARSTNAALRRLSFVLIGVATPADLIQDPKRTPFNIGERVDLGDFTPTEAAPLADGLGLPADRRTEALGWILAWTGGHPYLTQRLCSVLAADPPRPWSEAAVDEVVARTFLGDQSERDNNLQFVRDMLTKRAPHPYGQEVLRTYRAVWRGRRPVADEEQNLVHAHLKLSGVVRRQGQALVVRNRIYREVFNAAWIQEHDPESFWKRYGPVLKWVIPLTASSAVVAVAMAGLWLEAEKQRQNAEELANLAQQSKTLALLSEQKATQALTREKQARQKEQRANAARLTALQTAQTQRQRAEEKTLLARQEQQRAEREKTIAQIREQAARVLNLLPTAEPIYGMVLAIDTWDRSRAVPEAQGASASSLLHALQGSRESNQLQGHSGTVWSVAISPDGSRIVSGSVDNTVRIWDAKSGAELQKLQGHSGEVMSVAISRDGSRIVSGSVDNTVRRWVGSPEGWLALACERIRFHPLLRDPGAIPTVAERIEVARRARAVCERAAGGDLSARRSAAAPWPAIAARRLTEPNPAGARPSYARPQGAHFPASFTTTAVATIADASAPAAFWLWWLKV